MELHMMLNSAEIEAAIRDWVLNKYKYHPKYVTLIIHDKGPNPVLSCAKITLDVQEKK